MADVVVKERINTIFRSEEHIPIDLDEVTFAQSLMGSGYETGYAGKWRLDGPRRPGWTHPDRLMGFDDCGFIFNRGHWKKIEDSSMDDVEPTVFPYAVIGDEKTFATDWLTDKTLDFIGKPREAPFCYMVSYPDPHRSLLGSPALRHHVPPRGHVVTVDA
jgi:arylsulfatase A-like enzyme